MSSDATWHPTASPDGRQPELSTFSIVGADPEADECGVAVQSKFLAAGALVPWARGGVGAVATQAHANVAYGPAGLELLAAGKRPPDVIDELTATDELREQRQVGIVAADGMSASFTGAECFEFAASTVGEHCAAQGNVLGSERVPQAMVDAFAETVGPLSHRLMTALEAGQAAGGDRRGMESAALTVVRPGGGYGGNHDRLLDLRVDHADDPIADLRSLLGLHTLYFGRSDEADLAAFDEALQDEVRSILESIGWWNESQSYEDNLFFWIGWHNLEERWIGMERLDPLVLRELRSAAKGAE